MYVGYFANDHYDSGEDYHVCPCTVEDYGRVVLTGGRVCVCGWVCEWGGSGKLV